MENREVLREAGERGQQLLAEEASLTQRLEVCHKELNAASSPTAKLTNDSFGDDSFGDCEGSPSVARQQLRSQQDVIDRLKRKNRLLDEELEERESTLTPQLGMWSDDVGGVNGLVCGRADYNEETYVHLAALKSEVAEAVTGAQRLADARSRERDTLERELGEAQRNATTVLAVLRKHAVDARARNQQLRDEISSERKLRELRSAPLLEAIEELRTELHQARCTSDTADLELTHVRRELAVADVESVEAEYKAHAAELVRSLEVAHHEDDCSGSSSSENDAHSQASEEWCGDSMSASEVTETRSIQDPGPSRRSTAVRASRKVHGAGVHAYRSTFGRAFATGDERGAWASSSVATRSALGKNSATDHSPATSYEVGGTAPPGTSSQRRVEHQCQRVKQEAAAAHAPEASSTWSFSIGSLLGDALLKLDEVVGQARGGDGG